jgi:peptidoglycan hydrolase-like protein with peptidoglycan-binding domain
VSPAWYRRVLSEGDVGDDVAIIQRKLGLVPTGRYDNQLAQTIRGVQRMAKRKETGVVDADTAKDLGESVVTDLMPRWFHRPLALGTVGDDVAAVNRRLFVHPKGKYENRFTPDTEAAVRRLQSGNDLPTTGQVGDDEALLIGDDEIDD